MLEDRLTAIENLYAQRMKEYQEYQQAESNFNARASVRIQQMKDTLSSVPTSILERLGLATTVNIENMTYEQSKEYCDKVEKAFHLVADKIEAYLTTGDTSHLNGIEEAVGVAVQSTVNPLTEPVVELIKDNPNVPELEDDIFTVEVNHAVE